VGEAGILLKIGMASLAMQPSEAEIPAQKDGQIFHEFSPEVG
jgi:hypothetical protein